MNPAHSRRRSLRAGTDIHSEVHMQVVISIMASLKRFGLDILDSLDNYQD